MHRLRVIAGPNGSGKTTLTKDLKENYELNFGYYINADDIERILKHNNKISFKRYNLKIKEDSYKSFFSNHPLSKFCSNISFTIKRNTLYLHNGLDSFSYFTAILADFIRHQIVQSQQTFTFETVMSGKDKLLFLQKAKENKYRIYLYFICTDNVLINKDRVADRVEKGGHAVPDDKIEKRYEASLDNLLDVIKLSNRAYLFDNSGTTHRLVAEVTEGKKIIFDQTYTPGWFIQYVTNKIK